MEAPRSHSEKYNKGLRASTTTHIKRPRGHPGASVTNPYMSVYPTTNLKILLKMTGQWFRHFIKHFTCAPRTRTHGGCSQPAAAHARMRRLRPASQPAAAVAASQHAAAASRHARTRRRGSASAHGCTHGGGARPWPWKLWPAARERGGRGHGGFFRRQGLDTTTSAAPHGGTSFGQLGWAGARRLDAGTWGTAARPGDGPAARSAYKHAPAHGGAFDRSTASSRNQRFGNKGKGTTRRVERLQVGSLVGSI